MVSDALPTSASISSKPAATPPRFIVDLSAPAETRYAHIAPTFADEFETLPNLYDNLLSELFLWPRLAAFIARITPLLLRRLYDREETRELCGISKASGVPMHLLVAFNVLLDLFMGCTSGGVRVRDSHSGASPDASKMLHFRALDWGMDPLRKLVMEVEYVDKKDGPVVARAVTYFGYVGVLTGVRERLSMSLNFRPHHDQSTRWMRLGYVGHLLLVLFGFRRSISSVLRGYLLPTSRKTMELEALVQDLQCQKSTAAYLIFSDGVQTVSMEKDNGKASTTRSSDFIVTLNHDVEDEEQPAELEKTAKAEPPMDALGMGGLVEGSIDRKKCTVRLYDKARKQRRDKRFPELPLEEDEVVGWMEGPWIINDESHYGVIMDPTKGGIVWIQRWREPLDYDANVKSRMRAQRKWEKKAWSALKMQRATGED